MLKSGCKLITSVLLVLLALTARALEPEDAQLLQKEYQQYQAWALSRNYFFGTTVKKNRVQALAWQLIYVEQLPSSYPEKEKILAFYKQGLSPKQIVEANQISQTLRSKYHLLSPFTEAEMDRVFTLHEANASWSEFHPLLPTRAVWRHFKSWVEWLAVQGNNPKIILELEQKILKLYAQKKFPIIYGQIIVMGPEPLEMIGSEVEILPGGFFVTHPKGKMLSFVLPGYKQESIAINENLQIQALPPLILKRNASNKKTGVVGRVLPWFGVEKGNLLLQSQAPQQKDPWYSPALPLTVTNGGEFYITGLGAGSYKLYINTAGLSTVKEFTVREGEIRGLSLIDLRKLVH